MTILFGTLTPGSVSASILLLSYTFRYLVFDPIGALSGQVSNTVVFAVVFLIQFAYRFGGLYRADEARLLLAASTVIVTLVWASNFFLDLPMTYDFEAQYFTYEFEAHVSSTVLVGFVWALVVLLRRTVDLSRREGAAAPAGAPRPLGGRSWWQHLWRPAGRLARSTAKLALLTAATTVLSLLYLLFQSGLISRGVYSLLFNVGALLISLLIFVVYLQYAPRPTTYRAKLVGIPLATVMVAFTIAATWLMPTINAGLAATYTGRLWSLRSVLDSGVAVEVPDDVAFVVQESTPGDAAGGSDSAEYAMVYAAADVAEIPPADLVAAPGNTGLLPEHDGPVPDYTYLDLLDPSSYFIRYPVLIDDQRYVVGFRYSVYRQAIHRFAWAMVATILATAALVVVSFPLAYDRGLIRPLRALLGGVRSVERGDYHALVPVVAEDEVGRLARAFNAMVGAIRASEGRLQDQQEQLMHADKLASIGVLVASVAHEVNNPNQVVRLNANYLAETLPALTALVAELDEAAGTGDGVTIGGLPPAELSEAVAAAIGEIATSADRIHKIIDDLKQLARGGGTTQERELADVNEIVAGVARLARHFVQRSTDRFSLRLAERLPPVRVDRVKLE